MIISIPFVLVALVSLSFAVWAVTKAPWSWPARVAVAVATVGIGAAPIVWFLVTLHRYPPWG